jgi:hypothetical protein
MSLECIYIYSYTVYGCLYSHSVTTRHINVHIFNLARLSQPLLGSITLTGGMYIKVLSLQISSGWMLIVMAQVMDISKQIGSYSRLSEAKKRERIYLRRPDAPFI